MLYLVGERAIAERELLRSLAGAGDVVIDVGANIGYTSLLLSRAVGPAGQVLAIEPDEENLRELRRNVELNPWSRILVQNFAADRKDGVVRMEPGLNARASGAGKVEVPAKRLDSIPLRRIEFIKIDVEGHEYEVLLGSDRLLRTVRPRLLVEVHPILVPTRDTPCKIFELLRAAGYRRLRVFDYASGSVASKVRQRYFGGSEVEELGDLDQLLLSIESGEREASFWLVADHSMEVSAHSRSEGA